MKVAGIILIVVGALALVYQGFSYTRTEKDAEIGPIKIQHEEREHVPIPPIVGGICLVAGVAALVMGRRSAV